LIVIPYNPYESKPYARWTIAGMLDIQNELKAAEEFWDFLSGKGTYKATRTYLSARTLLNHFLKSILKTINYLDEISFDILQEYKTKEKERGQSINSVNSKIMKIKALFNYAIEDKKLKDNPVKRLKYIKQGRKIPHFLSIDEINKYKNANTNRNIYYLANLVALYTGFRPEEVYLSYKKRY
jgi:site-specific recombinase XerD